MKYRIGDVSRILNIPVETIRYYEKKGVIKPFKDEENNYRYYEISDMNLLLDYKKYRAMEFSMDEISNIMEKDSLNSFIKKIEERQDIIEKKLKFYQLLKVKNKNFEKVLLNIKKNLLKCTIEKFPNIYYLALRNKKEYFLNKEINKIFSNWIENYPFIEHSIRIKASYTSDFSNDSIDVNEIDYNWGLGIKESWFNSLDITLSNEVEYISFHNAIYTIIEIKEQKEFTLELLKHAFIFMKENNLKIDGDIIGNLLAKTHEINGYSRFIEFWIPIK